LLAFPLLSLVCIALCLLYKTRLLSACSAALLFGRLLSACLHVARSPFAVCLSSAYTCCLLACTLLALAVCLLALAVCLLARCLHLLSACLHLLSACLHLLSACLHVALWWLLPLAQLCACRQRHLHHHHAPSCSLRAASA
jgi:hypothetical protein